MDTQPPETVDVAVFDAMFAVRSLGQIPRTYTEMAKLILKRILIADRVDFVCDTYSAAPTIKDMEREARGSSDSTVGYVITGPEQNIPRDFGALLKLSSYKHALLNFLVDEWTRQIYADIIYEHKLHVGLVDKTWKYTSDEGTVSRQPMEALKCSHDEADTRVVWHLTEMSDQEQDANVVVRCDDTDILVMLLTHITHLPLSHLDGCRQKWE